MATPKEHSVDPTLDPIVKAVYIMYRSSDEFSPRTISEFVGVIAPAAVSSRIPSNSSKSSKPSFGFHKSSPLRGETSVSTILYSELLQLRNSRPIKISIAGMGEDEIPHFKLMLLEFESRWNHLGDKDITKIVETFRLSSAIILGRLDPSNSSFHFLYLAYFIDYLLSFTYNDEERGLLIKHRNDTIERKIMPPMEITKLPKFQLLAQIYDVNLKYINDRVIALKGECRGIDILNELKNSQKSRRYKEADFEPYNKEDYLTWDIGRKMFLEKAFDRFEKTTESISTIRTTTARSRASPRSVSPASPYICFDRLMDIFLSYSHEPSQEMINIITDCIFVWQLDGYELFISVLKAYVRLSTRLDDDTFTSNARSLAKRILNFCCLPYRLSSWPTPIKEQYSIFEKLNKPLKREICALIPNLFDLESAGKLLPKLAEVKFNSPLGINPELRKEVEDHLSLLRTSRYKSKAEKLPDDLSISFNHLFDLLESVIEDVLYLDSGLFKGFDGATAGDWNLVDSTKDFLVRNGLYYTRRALEYMIKSYSFDSKSGRFIMEFKRPTLVVNREYYALLDDVLLAKDISNVPAKWFSDIIEVPLYPLYYNRCADNCEELSKYSLNAINGDDYTNLPLCGHSKSVKDLFELFEKYLSDMKKLNWLHKYQNATMYTKIYETIADILSSYAETLTMDITDDLVSNTELRQDICPSYVKINNLYTVIEKLDDIFKDDLISGFSNILSTATNDTRTHDQGKLISIQVIKAENVEDTDGGKKFSAFIKLDGPIKNRTRTVYDEAYPEWNEEFETVINHLHPDTIHFRLFNEVDLNTSRIIETFDYELKFEQNKNGIEQLCRLSNNNGINLHLNYTFETVRDDPVFYSGRTRTTLTRSTQRIIKVLVSKYTKLVKSTFTKKELSAISKESPGFYKIGDFAAFVDDPELIKDQIIVDVRDAFLATIRNLSSTLVPKAIDQLILNTWEVTLAHAINLILPPLASINSRKMINNSELSQQEKTFIKRLSISVKSLSLISDDDHDTPLTVEQVERVISWVYKLLTAIKGCLTEEFDDLLFNKDLDQLLQIRSLYYLDFLSLQREYIQSLKQCERILNSKILKSQGQPTAGSGFGLTRASSVMKRGTIKSRKSERQEINDQHTEERFFIRREAILRVILTKKDSGAVKFVSSKMEEFEKFHQTIHATIAAQRLIQRTSSSSSAITE